MNAEELIISTANEIFNHYMNRRYKKGDVTTADILKKFAESYAEAKSKEVAEDAFKAGRKSAFAESRYTAGLAITFTFNE